MNNLNKWDERFLEMAAFVSRWSKDPSTKVGAIFVDDSRRILATGYNGFPKRIADKPELYEDRKEKYARIVHAEKNGIYNACSHGVSLSGSTVYASGLDICLECAKALIQVGVKRVVVYDQQLPDAWVESCAMAEDLLLEANVSYSRIPNYD